MLPLQTFILYRKSILTTIIKKLTEFMILECILNNPKGFVTLHTDLTAYTVKPEYWLMRQSFTVILVV